MSATQDCECTIQDPRSCIHVTTIACTRHQTKPNPWHYTGNSKYHSDDNSAAFIDLCKKYLPSRELPIRLGNTGYLNMSPEDLKQPNGWCLDELGRAAILLNGVFMFQRYTEGDVLVQSTDGQMFERVTRAEINSFVPQLYGVPVK